jgi:hypothetical protein
MISVVNRQKPLKWSLLITTFKIMIMKGGHLHRLNKSDDEQSDAEKDFSSADKME